MRFTEPLRLNREFRRVYARGRNVVGSLLALYARANRTNKIRLGITVSTKVGGAVVRNRVRRRIKEAYRLGEAGLRPGFDLVIVARIRAGQVSFHDLQRELTILLGRLSLLVGAL